MTPHLTQDTVVTLVLVCLVIVFLAAEMIVNGIVKYILDGWTQASRTTRSQWYKYSRIAAAALIMRFVSILLKVVCGLALAIGLFKAFGDFARVALPDRTLGFVVLISYCGLASVFGVIAEDLREALRKLLSGK